MEVFLSNNEVTLDPASEKLEATVDDNVEVPLSYPSWPVLTCLILALLAAILMVPMDNYMLGETFTAYRKPILLLCSRKIIKEIEEKPHPWKWSS